MSCRMRHELNNTLQVIVANLEVLQADVAGNVVAANRVATCLEALDRTMALIASLPDDPPRIAAARRLRIVLSEDEVLTRVVTASLLSDMGHDVVQVATSRDALAALDRSADMLITDLNLPDMNGEALSIAARAKQPQLGVIIATGDQPTREQAVASDTIWLTKPFSALRLRNALRAALRVS